VITQSNQIKTVKMNNYVYPSDAVDAAVAQTKAKRVIWYKPVCETVNYSNSYTENYETITDLDTSFDYDVSDLNIKFDTPEKKVLGFIFITVLPTTLLIYIHPILSIIFTIIFARWWFTK
jgi:hypothetical protein